MYQPHDRMIIHDLINKEVLRDNPRELRDETESKLGFDVDRLNIWQIALAGVDKAAIVKAQGDMTIETLNAQIAKTKAEGQLQLQ